MQGQRVAGAHGDGGFLHQNHRLFAVTGHGIAHAKHRAQVSRTVFAGRGADGNKQHLTVLHGQLFITGEPQALAVEVLAHQSAEPRFKDADVALLQQLDLVLVDVHADHIVTDFRQHRRLHQAYITTTEYTDFHAQFLELGGRRELMVSTPRMTSVTPRVFESVKFSWNIGRLAASRYTKA